MRTRGVLPFEADLPTARSIKWPAAETPRSTGSPPSRPAQVDLHPDRFVFVECDKEEAVLASFEEALRYGGVGAVVAELVRLP